jgi:hypothetical protein
MKISVLIENRYEASVSKKVMGDYGTLSEIPV